MDLLTTNHGLSLIAVKIFKLLKKKDLFKCRLVARSWRDCIDADIFWWRLHIENVYKAVEKTKLPLSYTLIRPVGHNPREIHCRPRILMKVFDMYPDMVQFFERALKQNMEITQELIPKLKEYHKENRKEFQHPIHWAASVGDIDFIIMLHDYCDADYNYQHQRFCCCRCSPLNIACQNNQVEMVEFLFEHLENEEQFKNAFLIACLVSNIQTVEKFVERALDQGIELNATNYKGETALHVATRKKMLKHVKLILKHSTELGIDVNATDTQDEMNYTAFHHACSGSLEMVQLFVNQAEEKGIDLNRVNGYMKTGLMVACETGSLDVIDFLLEASTDMNIDLNAEDILGRTAFMIAYEDTHSRLDKIKAFIRHADHIHLDNSKYGILCPVLENKDVKLFELLMKNASKLKIDVNAKDNGRTYLHHLCECFGSSPGIVKLLLNCPDIDINIKDNEGKTALDVARECRKRILANLILKRQREDAAIAVQTKTKRTAEEADLPDSRPTRAKRKRTKTV